MASFDEAAELNQLDVQEWQRFWSLLRGDMDTYSDIIAYWVRKPEGGFWSISSQLKDSLTQDGFLHRERIKPPPHGYRKLTKVKKNVGAESHTSGFSKDNL